MNQFIAERVVKTGESPLSDADIFKLDTRKKKLTRYILYAYIPLSLVLLVVLLNGVDVINRKKNSLHHVELDEEGVERFALMAPYVCGFFFIMLTLFFIHYYLVNLAPVLKDIKLKKKTLLYFAAEKTSMEAFGKFYLTTPIRKQQQLQVEQDDFNSIPAGELVCLEIAGFSKCILGMSYREKQLRIIESVRY